MSNYTTTGELLDSELFFRAYLSAVEETPDDISRLLSEFRELKSESGKVLQAIDMAIGFGSGKLSTETMCLVKSLLEKHVGLQDEMRVCAAKLKVLINGVSANLDELAAISNPNAAVKATISNPTAAVKAAEEDEEVVFVPPEPVPVIVIGGKRRGRKPKMRMDESEVIDVDGLDLLASAATMVSPEVKQEPATKAKKVPITKFKKKARKRSKNSEGASSKEEEQSGVEDADDSADKPEEELFCLCNGPSSGKMVCCDNETCSIEWFHFDCVNLKKPPPSKWFCPKCRGRKSNIIKKEIEAAAAKYQKYYQKRNTRKSMF